MFETKKCQDWRFRPRTTLYYLYSQGDFRSISFRVGSSCRWGRPAPGFGFWYPSMEAPWPRRQSCCIMYCIWPPRSFLGVETWKGTPGMPFSKEYSLLKVAQKGTLIFRKPYSICKGLFPNFMAFITIWQLNIAMENGHL